MLLDDEYALIKAYASADAEEYIGGRLHTDGFELLVLRGVIGVASWDAYHETCYVWIPWHPVAAELMRVFEQEGKVWIDGPTGEFISQAAESISAREGDSVVQDGVDADAGQSC